jgi:MOSC domain-containing protein YiiM
MHILSINIGSVRTIGNANVSGETGIYKLPVTVPVQVTIDGLADDAIVDTKNHGGPDQAVYVYGAPDYAWWSAELGQELAPGTFGENLTISDVESAQLSIGDRLHIGDALHGSGVILEVAAPRIPCWKLAQRMGDPGFVKRFRAAERPGFYCRVVRTGEIRADALVTLEPYAGERVKVVEVFREYYEPASDPAALRRFLAAPLSVSARKEKERQLRGEKRV